MKGHLSEMAMSLLIMVATMATLSFSSRMGLLKEKQEAPRDNGT